MIYYIRIFMELYDLGGVLSWLITWSNSVGYLGGVLIFSYLGHITSTYSWNLYDLGGVLSWLITWSNSVG